MKLATLRPFVAGGLFLAGLFVLIGLGMHSFRGSTNAGQPPLALTIKMKDVSYDVTTITAKVGQTVTIRLENDDDMDHALYIDALNVESDIIGPNQVTSVTFTPQQAGTYQFYCPMPGHAELGMVGTLNVVP